MFLEGHPVGLFRPYERKAADAPGTAPQEKATGSSRISSLTPKGEKRAVATATSPATAPTVEAPAGPRVVTRTPQKKEGATPTRRQAEADRMQRLHPNLSKSEQRRADRDSRYKSRVDTWDKVENSPERTLLRDYIDVRWTITEFMLPAMLVLMAGVAATTRWLGVSTYLALGLWVLLGLSFINTAVMWSGFKKVLAQRVPNASKRGLLMYMFNRSLMIRRFRRPGPRVARGASI
ncbi:DUF3043 domain-containing protein [Tessaracoccus antarcticus]|uniref:DUF3043 domain-containing protein n=1 Tax=Tessaracoccus antarcticus TaxID=2479848 RepID=A0A3M0G697_9ACTN|nr:DUF3043 domain-containing protein [Tessaracoccus antarcticus]RMB59637.1 DUF3043 domain-containing protein [Tessaracoccus antarcticus]